MKKEWTEEDHCPYCKRHCSLKDPHCGKGKSLAKSITGKKDSMKVNAVKDIDKEELKKLQSDLKLFVLYEKANECLMKKADGKNKGKKLKGYILNILAENNGISPKELKESSGLLKEELKKVLEKLSNKKEISIQGSDEKSKKIFLTEKGREAASLQLTGMENGSDGLFSVLGEEEKENLEKILRKLMGSME
ncbi:MarR family winged helix-turn-helix transcriptional regulator [Lacrimispora aerotolerans]|uniref:MarR family winged helix-turn-helix transcriptional regulator n=1 Tax=Lacrimispora aerotolerans TaxID=36832 RepID=UPI0004798BED|nr:MarR family winged helix-turn-helix transcriptional regulator [Lacrimispora aerotolerans]